MTLLSRQVQGLEALKSRSGRSSTWNDCVNAAIDEIQRIAAEEPPKEEIEASAIAIFLDKRESILFPLHETWETTNESARIMYRREALAAYRAIVG